MSSAFLYKQGDNLFRSISNREQRGDSRVTRPFEIEIASMIMQVELRIFFHVPREHRELRNRYMSSIRTGCFTAEAVKVAAPLGT